MPRINLKIKSRFLFEPFQLTSNWLGTSSAAFGEQLSEAISAIRLLVATSEALSSKWDFAVSTDKAFAMPWIVLISNTSCGDDLEIKDANSVIKETGAVDFFHFTTFVHFTQRVANLSS